MLLLYRPISTTTTVAILILLAAIGSACIWLGVSDSPAAYGLRYLAWQYSVGPPDSSFIDDGVELHYTDTGKGQALVFLHGGNVDRDVFFAQLPRFARDHRVVAPDTRGHGLSARGTAPLSYALYARDVLALMDHLGIRRATLIGWSDGGNTALRFAVDYPPRVCRIVLISANFHPRGVRALPPNRTTNEGAVTRLAHRIYRRLNPLHRFEENSAELRKLWQTLPMISEAELREIIIPVLILGGEFDLVDPAHLRAMHEALPAASIHVLPGIGHGVPYEAPTRVNGLIERFLEEENAVPCSTM